MAPFFQLVCGKGSPLKSTNQQTGRRSFLWKSTGHPREDMACLLHCLGEPPPGVEALNPASCKHSWLATGGDASDLWARMLRPPSTESRRSSFCGRRRSNTRRWALRCFYLFILFWPFGCLCMSLRLFGVTPFSVTLACPVAYGERAIGCRCAK